MNLSGYTIVYTFKNLELVAIRNQTSLESDNWPTTALYYFIILMDYFCSLGPLQSFFWNMMHQLIFQIIMVCVILEVFSFKDSKNDLWFLRNEHLPLSTSLIQHSKWVQENHYINLIPIKCCISHVALFQKTRLLYQAEEVVTQPRKNSYERLGTST